MTQTKSASKGHYIAKHKGIVLELYTEYSVPKSLEKLLTVILKEFSRRSPDKLQQLIDYINAERQWLVNDDWDARELAESIELDAGPDFWKALMESPYSPQEESEEDRQYNALKDRVCKMFESYRLFKYLSHGGGSLTAVQQKQVNDIEAAVLCLPDPERRAIEVRYYPPDSDYITDYDASQLLQINEGAFQKRRRSAFTKLAVIFDLAGRNDSREGGQHEKEEQQCAV